MTEIKKIAIYSRKSKFTGVGDSIGNQIQMCKDYCELNYKDQEKEYFVFEDEGFSGSNLNRPQFKKMMQHIKDFDVLICYRLDRLSRDTGDFATTYATLTANKVDFISVNERFDTSNPLGKAMLQMSAVFAELERSTIAERVRENMLENAKNGYWTGGRIPLGFYSEQSYFIDDEGKQRQVIKLLKNEDEAKLVKQIFDVYLKEGSLHKTEVYFVQNNIKSNRGILLEKTSLRTIIQNPVYVKSSPEVMNWLKEDGWNVYGEPDGIHSLLSYNKTEGVKINGKFSKRIKDKTEWIAAISTTEGIIEHDIWIKAQEQLKANKDTFPRLGKTHNALLAGKLKCALCGGNMTIQHGKVSKKDGHKFFYYVCSNKKRSRSTLCKSRNVKVDELDLSIIREIENIAKHRYDYVKKLKERLKKEDIDNNKAVNKTKITKEINDKKNKINRLVDKLSIDDSIQDIIIERIKSLKDEVTKLEAYLIEIDNKIKNTKDTNLNIEFLSEILDRCTNISNMTQEEQKRLIDLIVDDIQYNGDTGEVEINIINSKKK